VAKASVTSDVSLAEQVAIATATTDATLKLLESDDDNDSDNSNGEASGNGNQTAPNNTFGANWLTGGSSDAGSVPSEVEAEAEAEGEEDGDEQVSASSCPDATVSHGRQQADCIGSHLAPAVADAVRCVAGALRCISSFRPVFFFTSYHSAFRICSDCIFFCRDLSKKSLVGEGSMAR
jgi:hypothetical protein